MSAAETPISDSEAVARALCAIVKGGPRGTLSVVASCLGMKTSPFRKRLKRPGAGLDEATLKAFAFILDRKSENYAKLPLIAETLVGNYVIEQREAPDGEIVVTWRIK